MNVYLACILINAWAYATRFYIASPSTSILACTADRTKLSLAGIGLLKAQYTLNKRIIKVFLNYKD